MGGGEKISRHTSGEVQNFFWYLVRGGGKKNQSNYRKSAGGQPNFQCQLPYIQTNKPITWIQFNYGYITKHYWNKINKHFQCYNFHHVKNKWIAKPNTKFSQTHKETDENPSETKEFESTNSTLNLNNWTLGISSDQKNEFPWKILHFLYYAQKNQIFHKKTLFGTPY